VLRRERAARQWHARGQGFKSPQLHQAQRFFTEGASYHERVMGEPIRGRDGIRDYWQTKVVGTQANISCVLLNLYLDDGTAIAEWEAIFDDTAQQVRKRMREVALLTFDGPLIDSLREYWALEVVELSPAARAHQQRNPSGG